MNQKPSDIVGADSIVNKLRARILETDKRLTEVLKERNDLQKHFKGFVSFAASCQRENTHDWMCLMLDHLNGAASRLEPGSYFNLVGAHHFVALNIDEGKESEA